MSSPDAGLQFQFSAQQPDTLVEYLLWRMAGGILGSEAGASLVHSAEYESAHVFKASPGTLITAWCCYNSGPDQFIQLHNSATLPADGAVPVAICPIKAGQTCSFSIDISGMPFDAGIVVCNSSTGPTKTIGAEDCFFTGVVK